MDKYVSQLPLLKPDQYQYWPPMLTLWFMVLAAIPPALPYEHWVPPPPPHTHTMFIRLSMLIKENGISKKRYKPVYLYNGDACVFVEVRMEYLKILLLTGISGFEG